MAYPQEFLRLQFLFTALGSGEIAETGLQIAPTTGGTLAATMLAEYTTADLEGFASNLNDVLTGDEIRWANYSRLGAVKMSAHLTSGVQTGETLVAPLSSPFTGASAQVHPQNTVLLSLWSGYTVGVGNHGRMYLPHTQVDLVGSTPFGDPVDASFNAAHGAAFINAINTVSAAKAHIGLVTIMSRALGAATKTVQHVRVGTITDTQRRRYDSLPPSYVTADV